MFITYLRKLSHSLVKNVFFFAKERNRPICNGTVFSKKIFWFHKACWVSVFACLYNFALFSMIPTYLGTQSRVTLLLSPNLFSLSKQFHDIFEPFSGFIAAWLSDRKMVSCFWLFLSTLNCIHTPTTWISAWKMLSSLIVGSEYLILSPTTFAPVPSWVYDPSAYVVRRIVLTVWL